MRRDRTFILLLGLALVTGCGDDGSSSNTGGSGGAAASGGSSGSGGEGGSGAAGGMGGEGGELGTPALDSLGSSAAYAVVSSDFSSTSIAMLDEEFEIIDESWLNSGTTYPGLVATLSGDVVLPTRQQGNGTFTVVDRFLTDVVTQFFLPTGNLNGQLRTQGDTGASGFSSNPQDIIFVDEESAWIPRYESNLDPSAAPENQGNDLIEINPSDWSPTGRRFDLSSFNTMETVDGATVETFARPGRGVRLGSVVLLGLDRISASFDAAGPGALAVVDTESESILGVELDGLKSCGRVVPIPGASSKAAIACVGFSNPFGDEAQIRASAGILIVDVAPGRVTVEQRWQVSDDESSAIAVHGLVALDDERVLAVANGNFVDTTDVLYEVDLIHGTESEVLRSEGSFTIGVPAYDPDAGMLYVPDASASAVIELAENIDGFTEVGSMAIAPGLGLPPTQVYRLD